MKWTHKKLKEYLITRKEEHIKKSDVETLGIDEIYFELGIAIGLEIAIDCLWRLSND